MHIILYPKCLYFNRVAIPIYKLKTNQSPVTLSPALPFPHSVVLNVMKCKKNYRIVKDQRGQLGRGSEPDGTESNPYSDTY